MNRDIRFCQLAFIVMFICTSCKTENESNKNTFSKINNNIEFVVADTINIDINDSTINTNPIYVTKIDDHPYFYLTQDFDSYIELFMYSLDNLSRNSIKLYKDGPKSLGPIYKDVNVVNEDTIIVIGKDKYIRLVDHTGKEINRINADIPDNYPGLLNTYSNKILYENNRTIVGLLTDYSVEDPDYYTRKMEVVVNVEDGESNTLSLSYPSMYQEGFYGPASWNYTKVLFGDKLLINFIYDNCLYAVNLSNLSTTVYCNDSEVTLPSNPIPADTEMQKQMEYLLRHNQFLYLLSDKSSPYLFRVISLAYDEDEIKEKNWWDRNFLIEILNSELKIVGSKEFKGGLYNIQGINIVEGKLFLPFHNKSNLKTSEDKLIFHTFEIKN